MSRGANHKGPTLSNSRGQMTLSCWCGKCRRGLTLLAQEAQQRRPRAALVLHLALAAVRLLALEVLHQLVLQSRGVVFSELDAQSVRETVRHRRRSPGKQPCVSPSLPLSPPHGF